jgi:hypothetical protein
MFNFATVSEYLKVAATPSQILTNYLITSINMKPNVINIYSWCPIFSVVTNPGSEKSFNYVIGTDSTKTYSI